MIKQEIFETIDVLSDWDVDSFQKLHYMKIETATKKAVLIDTEWIPKSQLRCDHDENLYVSNWLYDKLYGYDKDLKNG